MNGGLKSHDQTVHQTGSSPDLPLSLGVGDFDSDGRDDVVTVSDEMDSVIVIANNGTTIATRRVSLSLYGDDIAVGDLNRDGDLDFMTDSVGKVPAFFGKGDGTFTFHEANNVPGVASAIELAHVNDDAQLDLVAKGLNDVTVFLGVGDGRFDSGLSFGVAASPSSIATGDFDDDGRIDVVVASPEKNVVTILTNRINRPPLADGGPNGFDECDSPYGTSVALDGSGSIDPDGDEISHMWTGTGVVIADPQAVRSSGVFPLGTSTVTLVVSDGEFEGLDSVDIEVVDSIAPDVTAELRRTTGQNEYVSVDHELSEQREPNSDDETRHQRIDVDRGGQSGDRSGRWSLRAIFSASDVCDAAPTITAELQLGRCGTLPVLNEQLIRYRPSGRCKTGETNGVLEIEAPSFSLRVTATDDSGNTRSVIQPISHPRGADTRRSLPRAPQIQQEPQRPKH
jgi:hypothetical protein